MANVVLKSTGGISGVNLGAISVGALFGYDFTVFNPNGNPDTLLDYDNALNSTLFTGVNFAGTFMGGTLTSVTGGTVQTIAYEVGGVNIIRVTGASVSAVTLFNSAVSNNTALFYNTVLAGNDTITGTAFADVFRGANGNDTLNGFGGNDNLKGEAGLDTMRGGAGRDLLYGGANNDIFDFNLVTESGLTVTTRDVIMDFVKGQDKIDLLNIGSGDADGAFSLLARDVSPLHNGAVATGKVGWYWEGASTTTTADNKTVLKINNDGDAAIEMTIELRGIINLSAAPGVDFIF